MPSLEFNSVDLLRVAYTASERAVEDFAKRGASALTADSLVAVVFAAAAIEAFTDDVADHVTIWRGVDWAFNTTTPELIRAVEAMIAIDRGKTLPRRYFWGIPLPHWLGKHRGGGQLMGKLRATGRALSGEPKRHDGRELQDLRRLILLRDAIMHARAPRPAPRPGLVEVMADLRRDGLTVPITWQGPDGVTITANASVFLELQSPRVAVWAYCAAYRVIHAMLDLVPPDVEAIKSLRDVLRDQLKVPRARC